MGELSNKVSYIKGLAEGVDLEDSKSVAKVIGKVLDVLSDLADSVEELELDMDEAYEMIDELDNSLCEIYDEFDEEDDFWDDDEEDVGDYDFDEDDDDDWYEFECPICHEDVMIEYDMIDDDNAIICPNCHREIPLEFEFSDDGLEENED